MKNLKKNWQNIIYRFLNYLKNSEPQLKKAKKYFIFYGFKFKKSLREIAFQLKEIYGILNRSQKIALSFAGFFLISLATISVIFFPHHQSIADQKNSDQNLYGVGGGLVYSEKNSKLIDTETEQLKQSLLNGDSSVEDQSDNAKEGDSDILQKYVHVVKKGDTLSQIATDYNVSVESIAGSSGIRMIDSLHVGQELQIPSRDGFFYTVEEGDRLAKVLDKYGVDYQSFVEANKNLSPDLIEAGDEIFLSGAKPKNIIRSWLVPVPSRLVTSGYGWRTYPSRAFHKGLDFRAAYVGVRASKSGTVTFTGRLGGYGNVVIIRHGGGYRTLYAHLSRIYVRKGSRVMAGTTIAKSGNSGRSTGPHLHFEISKNGKTVNPASILPGLRYKHR